jgi:four helix bundle protein
MKVRGEVGERGSENGDRGGIGNRIDHKAIQNFEDLTAWKVALDLAKQIYKLTQDFPKEEIFSLTSQIRRCSSSVSANIAEGFGRRSPADKLHFYQIAYGSLLETKNFLYLSRELKFASSRTLNDLLESITRTQQLLNALISSTRKRQSV